MHPDFSDMPGLDQTHVAPGATRIGGLVDAVAVRGVAPDGKFSAPDIDDIGIGLGDRDRADGSAEVAVAHRGPGLAAIGGLEDATAGRTHPVLVGPRLRARTGHRPAAAERAGVPPAE